MELELQGKVAVVTGGSKGIGLAVAQTLAAEGVAVVVGARSVEQLPEIDGVSGFAVDLSSAGGPAALVAHAAERHGGAIDILVNNVGGAPVRLEGFLAIDDDAFAATMNLNFYSALRAIRAVLPGMIERGSGAIVNVASVNAFLADPNVIDYSAAKAALVNASKSLSQELGPKGVRINDVSPGPVATDLWLGDAGVAAQVAAAGGGDAKAGAEAAMVTGRFTTPQEVATLVALLASPRTANVTGSQYVIDGGLVKTL
ncbi:3-oxoacyl-[acyl-carrier-protein] reductase FabG [Baekduia alba]|uniref:SDR family NAD(P)-dependent oxidoreductase n=1 Tax=Baekduia alba TaxID=2997333 RepID=UPI00234087B0|nr:SDR family NAD(P)-dependent oxidoreductase [Baekduia alba]WCB92481.1 3-oxoacyl-[acyl-carrier-protein] reductase FabG [Baekduia alba]